MSKLHKNRLKALLLLVLGVYLSNIVSDYFTKLILPQSLLTEVTTKPITDVATQNLNEFVRLGYIIMAIRLLSLVAFTYFAVLIIHRKKWLA